MSQESTGQLFLLQTIKVCLSSSWQGKEKDYKILFKTNGILLSFFRLIQNEESVEKDYERDQGEKKKLFCRIRLKRAGVVTQAKWQMGRSQDHFCHKKGKIAFGGKHNVAGSAVWLINEVGTKYELV